MYKFISVDITMGVCNRCDIPEGSPLCTTKAHECLDGLVGYYKKQEPYETSGSGPAMMLEKSDIKPIEGYRKEDVSRDMKYDEGKPLVGQMHRDFPNALLAVAEVTRYGVKKYKQPGSWKGVPDAHNRYEEALGRHDLMSNIEECDEESGLLHAAHRAWNALALLELKLMEGN